MSRQMKDSGIEWIGEIPKEWNVSKVKYFIECYDGRRIPIDSGERKSGPYPYWGAGSITDYVDNYIFDEELILLGEDGAPFFDHTRPVAFLVNEKIWVNNHIHVLKPHKDVCSRYLVYFLNNVDYKSYINGSILNKLTQSNMNTIAFVFPDITEQERIASFLDQQCAHIDTVIEKTKTSIEEYKKLKQAVITQAVTKGIRGDRPMKDSGIEYIGLIPEDWKICQIRHIGIPQNGISKGAEFFGSGYPFVSYGDVYRNISLPKSVSGLIQSNESERELYSVKKGDIFFTRTSETIEEVGFTSVCEQDIPDASFAGFLIRVRPFDDTLYEGFSKYYFRSSHHRFYLVKEMNLVTRASLGQTLLKAMPVLVPDKEEQREIAEYLDGRCSYIDMLIEMKERTLFELENYKKSMIYEYVTGKKEVD